MDYLDLVCNDLGFEILERYNLGHVSKGVAKVRPSNDLSETLVIKTANDLRTLRELRSNYNGYQALHGLGIGRFTPGIYDFFISERRSCGYILMEYAGENFYTLAHQSPDPFRLYEILTSYLFPVYQKSQRRLETGQSIVQLRFILNKSINVVQRYLKPFCDNQMDKRFLQTHSFIEDAQQSLRRVCFSHWTFTPEDVYVNQFGVQHSDLDEDVLGIPIIDLGCFAGVARDEYKLSASTQGYEILLNFAVTRVAELLEIRTEVATRIFYLARALQSFLTARYSLGQPATAEWHFATGVEYLEKVYG